MKKSLMTILGISLIVLACQEESGDLVSLESPGGVKNQQGPILQTFPIQQLLVEEAPGISNGFFWLQDAAGQVFTFGDGQLVCHGDYPNADFKPIHMKPNAPNGLYTGPQFEIAVIEGVASVEVFIWQNCVERYIYVPRDCPPGCIGATRLKIVDCYNRFTGKLISSDTTNAGGIPCEKIIRPEFDDIYWEDEFGNRVPNPICF